MRAGGKVGAKTGEPMTAPLDFPTPEAELVIRQTRKRGGIDQFLLDRQTLARLVLALRGQDPIERETTAKAICRAIQVDD